MHTRPIGRPRLGARLARLLAGAAIAASCGDPVVPYPPPAGVYVLRSVDGAALPYPMYIGSGMTDDILADTLVLYRDGTLYSAHAMHSHALGFSASEYAHCHDTWTQQGGRLSLVAENAPRTMELDRGGRAFQTGIADRSGVRTWRWELAADVPPLATAPDTIYPCHLDR